MEYFDVVDVNREKLNYTKQRGESLENHEYNQGIEVWIINSNKILMTKRSLNKSHPGQWEAPGGCSQAGESMIDTVKRELNEEIGIEITEDNVKLLATQLYKKQFVDIFYSDLKINIHKTTLQEEEVCDIKFISKDEFLKMKNNNEIVPSVLQRFEMIKDKLNLNW